MSYLILYHALCLVVLLLTYWSSRGGHKTVSLNLKLVYLMTGLVIVSDCVWSISSADGTGGETVLSYTINIIYFIAAAMGVFAWAAFALETLDSKLYTDKKYLLLLSLPAIVDVLMILSTPVTGFIFTIDNGQYIRGNVFYIDAIIKLCYLIFASVYSYILSRRESRKYLKRRDFLLALYCIPVTLAGILQAVFGLDLNCVAPVLGLAIVYKFGIANEAKDNSDIVKAIAKSYAAAFVINTDSHTVKSIITNPHYRKISAMTGSLSYEEILDVSVRLNVFPEDRIRVASDFAIDNVLEHLQTKNSYSIIYKVNSDDGQELYNKATFMKAFSDEDRHELFLGIERQDIRQILLQEKDDLEEERENFERIKEAFSTVIANVIEARDVDSGEHVMRVKSITQYICNQVMRDYPEYGLTPLKIRYITNGSALHDIGKIMIPDTILLKPEKLTDEEFEIMKSHTIKGCVILDKVPEDLDEDFARYSKEICRWHHERFDGGGYPDGLAGNDIPVSAQIVSIADCFDAMTTKRVYKEALSKEEAYEMMADGRCGVFNSDLLDCLSKVLDKL